MSIEQRQSSKLLEPGSFDVYKNTAVLMIVILDCSKVDIEVLDADMETMESDGCRGISEANGDANGMLTTM